MNIFKILSSGDQKLKEPAVTSFLAYLLDPYEGHGLNTRFLEYFLKPIVEKEENAEYFKELLINKKLKSNLTKQFAIEVKIEVSVTNQVDDTNKRRSDIDVTIRIFKDEKSFLFCVENKVQDGALNTSKKDNQLHSQLTGIITELESKHETQDSKISSIFLTHKSERADKYYKDFEALKMSSGIETNPSKHIKWLDNEDQKLSIYHYLQEILHKESLGIIEPIHDYTKYTIKAFMNFIDSGFKSLKQDKDESGRYKKKYLENLESLLKLWNTNNVKRELVTEILESLEIEEDRIAYTNRHISVKNKGNIAIIHKPSLNGEYLNCLIIPKKFIKVDKDYALDKQKKWLQVKVDKANINTYIENLKKLI